MQAVVWNDELWLGFNDESEAEVSGLDRRYPYRIIKVLPQCTYLSTLTKRLMGVPTVTATVSETLAQE